MGKIFLKKKYILFTIILVLISIIFYTLRSNNISNELKRLILPELELATGKKITIQKISINLIPFFIEMKNIYAYDDRGNRFFRLNKVKGYINLSGFFKKEIIIKKIVLKGPFLSIDRSEAESIINNVKEYLSKESKIPFKIKIKSIAFENGNFDISDKGIKLVMEESNSSITLTDIPKIKLSTKHLRIVKDGLIEYPFILETFFVIKENYIDIKTFHLSHDGSKATISGNLGLKKFNMDLTTKIELFMKSIKDIFNLTNKSDGEISITGKINTESFKEGIKNIFIHLNFKGNLYLETLMEFLKVKENLKGYLSFNGEIKGYFDDLRGIAKSTLKNGELFGVVVDELKCDILYEKGFMSFNNGVSRLYGGFGYAEAKINLPAVNFYTLKVRVKDINSNGLFKLIKWDPGLPLGKVSGSLESSGDRFNPYGNFLYTNTKIGDNVIKRIKIIEGSFLVREQDIFFPSLSIITDKSKLYAKGDANLVTEKLNFDGNILSEDIKELTIPYFSAFSGPFNSNFSLTGDFQYPVINLSFLSNNFILSTSELKSENFLKKKIFNFNKVIGELIYRKDLLVIKNTKFFSRENEYLIDGKIHFSKSAHLFDLKNPEYDLNVFLKNIDIKEILFDSIQNMPLIRGILETDFRLYGKSDDLRLSGNLSAQKIYLDSLKFGEMNISKIDGRFEYLNKMFVINNLNIRKGNSKIEINGNILLDKHFSLSAHSDKIKIIDLLPNKIGIDNNQLEILSKIFLTDVKLKGYGLLDNPNLEVHSEINADEYKGYKFGKGEIKFVLSNKNALINLNFLDNKINIKGKASLSDVLPWSAEVNIYPSRYDFLISRFLKDIPEDLLLNLSGKIQASGDKYNIKAEIILNKVNLLLYEIGFTNNSDVIATLNNKRLSIKSFSMKSDATDFNINGSIEIGNKYDITIVGSSLLTPIKALSNNIDIIRGNSSFVFHVSGEWSKPKINGGIDVNNGAIGFKGIPYRLTGVSAYIYVQDDKVVIDNTKGKVSGGDINLSGIVYLDKFSIKNFFIESRASNIAASISKDFWILFSGTLYYRGTKESQSLLGDIEIKKAKYSERVEWKSWLLKTKQKEMPKGELSKLEQTNLNIRLHGSDLLIDNNLAKLSMILDVIVRGTIAQPIVLGKADTKEGIVFFRNNEFKIVKGKIDFSNPTKTILYFDISALTNVKNYDIKLNLDGNLEQFNLSLSSNPPLDETDILSLLTVGQIGKQLKGVEGGIGASEATAFITGKMQDVLEERLKSITGFDRVQIDPYVSYSTGTVMPRLTVSKRLLGDKLYVTYSSPMGTSEEQILKLEYALEKNISIIGIRDEKGGIGGDIKFKFQFK
jgi:hypothetical protein